MKVPKPTLLPAAMPFSSAKTATMKLHENKTKNDFQLFSDIFRYFQKFTDIFHYYSNIFDYIFIIM